MVTFALLIKVAVMKKHIECMLNANSLLSCSPTCTRANNHL